MCHHSLRFSFAHVRPSLGSHLHVALPNWNEGRGELCNCEEKGGKKEDVRVQRMKGTRGHRATWVSWLSGGAVHHPFPHDCDLWAPPWREREKKGKSGTYRDRNRWRDTKKETLRVEWSPPVPSRCQTVCRPPSAGLWEGPSLVKPTDSAGRAAVHRSSVLLLAAQLWHKQILHCVYTGSLCMWHACLLTFLWACCFLIVSCDKYCSAW